MMMIRIFILLLLLTLPLHTTTMTMKTNYKYFVDYNNTNTVNTYISTMNNNNNNNTIDVEHILQNMSITQLIGQMSQIDITLLLYKNYTSVIIQQQQQQRNNNNTDVSNISTTATNVDDIISSILNQTALEYYIGTLGIGSVYNNLLLVPSQSQYSSSSRRRHMSSSHSIPIPSPPIPSQDSINTISIYRNIAIQIQQMAQQYYHPPVLWGLDSIHGAAFIYNTTITPHPINIAATFNTSTAYHTGRISSYYTRAAGIQWIYGPLLGLGIHSKWSRIYETYGEDPIVVRSMASSMIYGIQDYHDDDNTTTTDSNNTQNSFVPSRVAACAKHYIGYSNPVNGRDGSPSTIPHRHLYQYYVLPWKYILLNKNHNNDTNTIPLSVMESYTEIDGVPLVVNRNLLQHLLRYTLNFTGVLITDYQEIEQLTNHWHHVAKNRTDAVTYALSRSSSIDISMIPYDPIHFQYDILFGLNNSSSNSNSNINRLTVNRLRESVRRILTMKKDLHMFHETIAPLETDIGTNNHEQDMVLDLVHQSIVLVQNTNHTLPILVSSSSSSSPLSSVPETSILNVLVTGPTSHSRIYQSGGWTGLWQGTPNEDWFTYGSSVYDAFRKQFKNVYNVTYFCGTDIMGENCFNDKNKNDDLLSTPFSSITKVTEFVQNENVDVIIICLGEETYAEKPGDLVNDDLHLPEGQYNLVKSIRDTTLRLTYTNSGTKIILVYFGGRPRLLSPVVDLVDAILIGFLPGPSGGDAIMNIISGYSNPSGRLPISYPSTNNGLYPYFHTMSEQCIVGDGMAPHYKYHSCSIQWPFGHGLSYTTFQYSNLAVQRVPTTTVDDKFNNNRLGEHDLQVSVEVKNTGTIAGAETVLIFTFDEYRRTTPETKRLRTFQKILLQPNESVVVNVTIPADDLRFVGPNDDLHYIIDPYMTYWVGVGYITDCRVKSNSSMCIYMDIPRNDTNESDFSHWKAAGACNAACNVWIDQSGCAQHFSLSYESCVSMCTSIHENNIDAVPFMNNEEGWGWNYVNCIESVVIGFNEHQRNNNENVFVPTKQCWKMTALCRDIFHTGNLNEYGVGSFNYPTIPLNYILALVAGIISSLFIYVSCTTRVNRNGQQSHSSSSLSISNINDTIVNQDGDDTTLYQRLTEAANNSGNSEQQRERHQLIEHTRSLIGLD